MYIIIHAIFSPSPFVMTMPHSRCHHLSLLIIYLVLQDNQTKVKLAVQYKFVIECMLCNGYKCLQYFCNTQGADLICVSWIQMDYYQGECRLSFASLCEKKKKHLKRIHCEDINLERLLCARETTQQCYYVHVSCELSSLPFYFYFIFKLSSILFS